MRLDHAARRLLLAWSILLIGLAGFWFFRPWFNPPTWLNFQILILFGTSKIAMLIALDSASRRQLTPGRLLAFLLWPGMAPALFVPNRPMPGPDLSPSWAGCLVNLLTGILLCWLLPLGFPEEAPILPRAWVGLIGLFFFIAFGLMDLWVILYQRMGLAVGKLWLDPAAASGVADFWGKRWNRVYSGMLRALAFRPLLRRLGPK